ncbi:MAG TPA: S-methyl-5'-thioadenosine phosphorylase [Acidobacteriota bacterium]
MEKVPIGVLGGSGLYEMPGFHAVEEVRLTTPFGEPSDPYRVGRLEGKRIAFLARHGRGHRIPPSAINYRANLFGFKLLGVEHLISASAVGSLKQELRPLDFVVPDQFYDRTRQRIATFFDTAGLVVHVAFADPVCPHLSALLAGSADGVAPRVHRGGTYVCMEGPQFSTRAESQVYRQLGFSVIGMTNLTEAKLAREAEICYATLALVTDYDCWHETEVTIEQVIEYVHRNAANAQESIRRAVAALDPAAERRCRCAGALRGCFVTAPELVGGERRRALAPLIGRYLPEEAA